VPWVVSPDTVRYEAIVTCSRKLTVCGVGVLVHQVLDLVDESGHDCG
jgi:hypothetical protein